MALPPVQQLPDQRTEEVTGTDVDLVTVVLDTSVLVSNPQAIFDFPDRNVVVPLTVIEELDGLKTRSDEVGWAAREAVRTIEALRLEAGGDIRTAVPVGQSSTFRVETAALQLDRIDGIGLDPSKNDNRILAAALALADRSAVCVVSNDAALRIKAAQVSLYAEDYVVHRPANENDPGWTTIEVSSTLVDALYARKSVLLTELEAEHGGRTLYPNQAVVLRAGQQSALARRRGDRVVKLDNHLEAWGLKPRSKEQTFALDLLLDPDVALVALAGKAGTGKTLLALAAALEQVVEKRQYDSIGIYRPVVPVGKESDLGFLPGTLEEKLAPWMAAISDNVKALAGQGSSEQSDILQTLVERGQLELGSVAHVRGRSLSRSIIMIDEAQNLSSAVLQTLLTRASAGTKVVLTGDLSQIDSAYLSRANNGLSAVMGAFTGRDLFGHVLLTQGERSPLADLAAELL